MAVRVQVPPSAPTNEEAPISGAFFVSGSNKRHAGLFQASLDPRREHLRECFG